MNTARFLQTLDQDADPANGITISQNVQMLAQDWTLDINSNDFDQQLESIRSDLEEEHESFSDFPDEATARDHLESTLRCSYSGAYVGTYEGTDQGFFGILIDAHTGNAFGVAYSPESEEISILRGTRSISYDQNAAFTSADTDQSSEFRGQLTSVNTVQGQWSNPSDSSVGGSFSAERVGGDQYAVYRATGTWQTNNNEYGLFTFDINDSGRITGFAYNTAYDVPADLSGTLSGTNISASVSEGGRPAGTLTGTLDQETGEIRGSFVGSTEGVAFQGTVDGGRCRLN